MTNYLNTYLTDGRRQQIETLKTSGDQELAAKADLIERKASAGDFKFANTILRLAIALMHERTEAARRKQKG